MSRNIFRLALLLPIPVLCACTLQTAERVRPGNYDIKGVRYWLSAPYVLVTDRVRVVETQTVFLQQNGQFTQVAECAAPACVAVVAQSRPQSGGGAITGTQVTPPPQPNNGGGGGGGGGAAPKPATDAKPATAAASSAVSVVWMPDYCEQYAYRSKTFLAKADVSVSLADGWRLESVTANQDSTAIISKLFDLVGIDIQADAATEQARIEAESAQAGGGAVYWIRTQSSDLYPGVYPLFPRANCETNPAFNPKAFDIRQSVSWTRVDP